MRNVLAEPRSKDSRPKTNDQELPHLFHNKRNPPKQSFYVKKLSNQRRLNRQRVPKALSCGLSAKKGRKDKFSSFRDLLRI